MHSRHTCQTALLSCLLLIAAQPVFAAPEPETRITIISDAFARDSKLDLDWGFAALIEYDGKRILFDTGNNAGKFAANARALGVDLSRLDFVVISHRHGDHTDGLHHLLKINPDVPIYAPNDEYFGGPTPAVFFSRPVTSLPQHMRYFGGAVPDVVPHGTPWRGAKVQRVEGTRELGKGIRLVVNRSKTASFSETPEVSLVLDTPDGPIVIVGCSHPGIEQILESVNARQTGVRLVVGGLHLVTTSAEEIQRVGRALRSDFKVKAIAPGHCTGEVAFAALMQIFGADYTYAGAGTVIRVAGKAHPLLGSGHGVDHATILTRDPQKSVETYTKRLGFTATPYEKYENGFENTVLYFSDETYLELWGVHDSIAAAKSEIASVLAEPDGLTWLTLHVTSTDSAAAFLRARQHRLFGPYNCCGEPWLYRLTGLEKSLVPGREIYFIEYNEPYMASRPVNEERRRHRRTHANTAHALTSAWIAVKDPAAARKAYEGMGFTVTRTVALPHLRATAEEIAAGRGTILLVHATEPTSPVTEFLGARADRMMGLSVRVSDLDVARTITREDGQELAPLYDGPNGRSFLVPPRRAGGTWLEFHK